MAVLHARLWMCCVVVVPFALASAQDTPPACIAQGTPEFQATRPSPLDSLTFAIGGKTAKVCYSRPSVRGRMVFDSLVQYGKAWRTGANEPTMIHLPVAAEIAGAKLAPGRYLIMTVPNAGDWQIVFNTTDAIDPARMLENLVPVTTGTAKSERTDTHVEKMTIRAAGTPTPSELILEWEKTRVQIPIKAS